MTSKTGPMCACTEHDDFTRGKANGGRIIKLSSKKVRVSTISYMKTQGLMPLHGSAICECCKIHVEETLIGQNKLQNVDVLIQEIENGNVKETDIIRIVRAIGTRVSENIMEDALSMSTDYKREIGTNNISVNNWLTKRNAVVLNFMMSCANITSLESCKKSLCISGAINSLYKARMLNLVTPMPFYSNLVSYFISGSRQITRLNCTYSPAGSYSCLKAWLQTQAMKPLKKPVIDIDVVSFFDNNQVVARNWRVRYNYKTIASVITNIIHIDPEINTNLQNQEELCPSRWLYCDKSSNTIDTIKSDMETSDKTYDAIRDQFLSNRINMVNDQLMEDVTGDVTDAVDMYSNDGMLPILTKSDSDPYSWVDSSHPHNPPKVTVGEPCMVNPCSFKAVKQVLSHIQEQTRTAPGGRKWTIVGCDGLPYSLAQKLFKNPENEQLKNILLMPGNGHIEINATRAIFKLLWDVALEDVAKMHGFRTPRALLAAKNCADHHKSWQLLSVFLFGSIDEIIRHFILFSRSDPCEPSLTNFYKFIQNSTNPNYRFLCDMVLNYVLALFVFRCGVRRCNYKVLISGRNKLIKLFFGLNMTTYQSIMFHDLKMRALAPQPVLKFIQNVESFSVSGHKSKGEGGDFVLEAINGKTKRWLPPGAPTESQWLEASRNIDTLEEIRDTLFTEIGVKKSGPTMYQPDLSLETFQWRVHLRRSRYLQMTNNNHTSLSGDQLDKGLLLFERTCVDNFKLYLANILHGNEPGKGLCLSPVFVTTEDRERYHDIHKKTKAQISTMITECIKDVEEHGNVEEALVLERQWQKIKVGTKDALLQFYKEVVVALQDASNETSSDDDSAQGSDDEDTQ